MSDDTRPANGQLHARLRLRELHKTHKVSAAEPVRPLLDLILSARERQSPRAGTARVRPRLEVQRNAKRSFLAELEQCGDPRTAAEIVGCTPLDVQHWRSADQMFSRDFALAALHYVKRLKAGVQQVAESADVAIAGQARAVLQSESSYIGSDGRLNLRAWRDALEAFMRDTGTLLLEPASLIG